MSEDLSRLVDGELDDDAVDRALVELRRPEALATWTCYHMIGDQLRGTRRVSPGFHSRFGKVLASEPTVLAPGRRTGKPALAWAWAAAASLAAVGVVGWTAMSLTDSPETLAKLDQARTMKAAQVRPVTVPQDYVIVHQEYSPATALQGVGPYLRAVAAPGESR